MLSVHNPSKCVVLQIKFQSREYKIQIVKCISVKFSLKNRQFKSFLDEINLQYPDLEHYNNVRWLIVYLNDFLKY